MLSSSPLPLTDGTCMHADDDDDEIPDFFMTIPLTFLAERWGSRTILLLNLASRGVMLSWAILVGYFDHLLPTKAIIAGPAFSVLGGDCVMSSITYALISSMTDSAITRATYFGYMSSVLYAVTLSGPALASATMSLSLWLPFWLGILLLLLAVPIASMLPSDKASRGRSPSEGRAAEPLLSSPQLKARDTSPSLLSSTVGRFQVLQTIVTSHPRNFSLLLVSFVLTALASADTKLLVQYISKRYYWTFASAGYLISGKAVVNFILLTCVIPKLLRARANNASSSTRGEDGTLMNLQYSKLCLILSVLGALFIGLSSTIWILIPSMFIYALGSALPIFTLSLLKSPAISPPQVNEPNSDSHTESHIYSLVMMVKTLGSLLGAPFMAAIWVRAIDLGGVFTGLPYFVSAFCYVLAIGIFMEIKVDQLLPR